MHTLPERIVAIAMDADGTPKDKSLRLAGAPAPAAAADDTGLSMADLAAAFAKADDTPATSTVLPTAAPAPRARQKAKAEFIGSAVKGIDYDLEHPIRITEGPFADEYRAVRICSPLGSKFGEMQSLVDDFAENDIFVWLVCDLPIEVVEVLSALDKVEIAERGRPFLPRRIRAAMEEGEKADLQTTTN